MKDLRSDEGINQVPGILWPFSTVINPAVNLGQLCPSEDGSRVFSGCPGHCSPGEACLLTLPCSSVCWHFENWPDMWVGYEGWNHNVLEALDLVQRFSACTSFVPLSPLRYWKDWKGEVAVVSCLGRTHFPHRNCTFLPNPLLFFVTNSSLSIRPLKEWVVQAWAGPPDSFSGAFGSLGLHQGSHAIPGCWAKLGLGQLLANLHAGLALGAHRSQRVPWLHSEAPTQAGSSSVGHTPLHFSCWEATGMGVKASSPTKMLCQVLPISLPWRNRREGLGSKNAFKRLKQW